MAWSGGTFTRSHDWTADEGSAIDIEAARMDQEDDNLAAGINNCLTKDGQNTPTANLPMGGNRHTGVGNGAARTDYVAVNQIQDGDLYAVGSVAGTNTITGTMAPAITAYTNGMRVLFLPANDNTGAATLNLNSVGAQSITKNGTTALAAGDLVDGVWADCVYDNANTNWILLNPQVQSIASGGTGSTTASAARTALGLAIGTDVQAYDAQLADVAGLAVTNGNFIVGDGSNFVAESGATARASLGLTIGTHVQAWDVNLDQIAALAVTDGNIIVGNGSAWVAESGATARTSLGVGTGDSPQFTGINVGHASDTTITRDAAGQIAVEGDAVFSHASGTYTSAKITFQSGGSPSGGSDGDIVLIY